MAVTTTGATALLPGAIEGMPWQPCADWPGVSQKLLSSGPGSVAGLLRFAAGAGESSHEHRRGEHHVWVLEGSVRHDGTTLSAGSYLRVGPGVLHRLTDAGEGSVVLFVRVLD